MGFEMNIYLLTQNEVGGWDTYDSVVVSAESEEEARLMHPSGDDKRWSKGWLEWVTLDDIDKIDVKLIGASNVDKGVILASFNAG